MTSWPVSPLCRVGATVLSLTTLYGCAGGPLAVAADERAGSPRGRSAQSAPAQQAARPMAEEAPARGGGEARGASPRRVSPDVLVDSDQPLPERILRKLRRTRGVTASTVLGLSSVALHGHTVTVGVVRPSAYRVFAAPGTAGADRVWATVRRGEAIVSHAVARRLDLPLGGHVTLGTPGHRGVLRIGAVATTVPSIDIVVDRAMGRRLGIATSTTMLLSAGRRGAARIAGAARRIVDDRARVDVLGRRPSQPVQQRAFLSGGAAARAFGSFTYKYYPDGTIQPDPDWVAANIRTRRVPILGEVTCHRLMFPQLRGALREIVRRGLAHAIHPEQYGGCYVPRFIGRDPSNPISLHTWGIAIDLNVANNQRGTEGQIDPRVVRIFKQWGFAWGGDWDWPDPMHFELAGLLEKSG